MDRRRKLSDRQIRDIFKSREPAPVLSKRFGISEQMIYLIRSGRAHSRITRGRERSIRSTERRPATTKLDTIALADAIIDRVIDRLRGRDRSRSRR